MSPEEHRPVTDRRPAPRRRTAALAAALGAVLVATLAVPALAAPASPAGQRAELRGTLADVHPDTMTGAPRHETHLVMADGRSIRLDLPETTGHEILGAEAVATGVLRGNALAVEKGGLRLVQKAPAADATVAAAGGDLATATAAGDTVVAAAVTKKVAVILINFADDTRMPWTTAAVASNFFGVSPVKSVHEFYAQQSYGAWSTIGDVYGYYTITADRSACNWSDWGTKGRQAATAAGVDLAQYTNVVHVWPDQPTCGWAGLGYLPGTYSYLDGTISVYVAAHELGHNYGAHHASTLSCTDASGARVTLSTTCAAPNEYGDPFDVMGSALYPSHPWHRKQEAQLTTADQQTITTAGRYTVGVAGSFTPAAPRIVRIARGDGTFFHLEFRQPGGLFDTYASTASVVNGVLIRINPDTSRVQSRLLDATPETTSFGDAALPVGRTFTDPVSQVSVTTVSVGATGAVVDVTWGADTTAPSAVGSLAATANADGTVRLAWTAATDDRGVAGYEVARDGTVLAASVGTTSYVDATGTPGAVHTWTVRALDAAGNAGPVSTVSATVRVPDVEAPSAPGTLTVAAGSTRGSYRLTWSAASDNVAVTGYRVYDGSRLVVTVSGSTLTYQYKPGRGTHTWTVRAIDAAGNQGAATNTVTLATR